MRDKSTSRGGIGISPGGSLSKQLEPLPLNIYKKEYNNKMWIVLYFYIFFSSLWHPPKSFCIHHFHIAHNRPFPHSVPVSKHKQNDGGGGLGGQFHTNHRVLSTRASTWCLCFQECGMAGLYTLFIHQQIYITIVLNFSWDGCNTQEKLENMVTPFLFFVVGGEVK